ncbi:hypothetical protein BO71DRAFT_430230 [Aspergillus ellipticus CBS 707.79]|uniref:Uncharacterized protein n=1 Tax=Aspergillus ellipticus CBS 707.79 TaxID=1448320 RepID=A0A319ET52_9EURO|nr:hypothetical protein BO71DRAFT_430230 [Aspergillus ellipticus CBS 707.79]
MPRTARMRNHPPPLGGSEPRGKSRISGIAQGPRLMVSGPSRSAAWPPSWPSARDPRESNNRQQSDSLSEAISICKIDYSSIVGCKDPFSVHELDKDVRSQTFQTCIRSRSSRAERVQGVAGYG